MYKYYHVKVEFGTSSSESAGKWEQCFKAIRGCRLEIITDNDLCKSDLELF